MNQPPIQLPPLHDLVRLIRGDVFETFVALKDHCERERPAFTYKTSKALSPFLLSRTIDLNMALKACERDWSKVGKKQNAEVVPHIWTAGAGRDLVAYPAQLKIFPIRSDILIRVAPTFYFVENGAVSLFFLQPRKEFALSEWQLRLMASIFKLSYMVDDFQDVGLEILDLSVSSKGGPRSPTRYTLESFPLLSREEIEVLLQRFADAYDLLRKQGVTRKVRQPKQQPDPNGQLF